MTAAPPLSVRVPATSANLGPGFDAVGVALDAALHVWVLDRTEDRVLPQGEGAEELPTGDDNLVWQALVSYCRWAGVAVPDASLGARSEIPLERGMGSSSAAAVAGVVLGRALTGGGGADDDLVALAAELEGHVDNAAAAVLGGLVLCRPERLVRFEPTELLRPVVCIPTARQSTRAARALLPADIPRDAAAANAARLAGVVSGLCGAAAWDPTAMTDVLHEPARLEAMPVSGRLIAALRSAGLGACLSGAGPAVLVVVPTAEPLGPVRGLLPDGWSLRPSHWDRSGALVTDLREREPVR